MISLQLAWVSNLSNWVLFVYKHDESGKTHSRFLLKLTQREITRIFIIIRIYQNFTIAHVARQELVKFPTNPNAFRVFLSLSIVEVHKSRPDSASSQLLYSINATQHPDDPEKMSLSRSETRWNKKHLISSYFLVGGWRTFLRKLS